MRILVLGAGAVGGYFGGRLTEVGRDVTFLVRPSRAASLAERGLRIESPMGDAVLPKPQTVARDAISGPYDLILLGCKAYDLDDAIAAVTPAVGPATAILPLLNGIDHLRSLEERFGGEHVLGGQCVMSSTLAADGTIRHLNAFHSLTYGERDGTMSPRMAEIGTAFEGARFEPRPSEYVLQEMWEKWYVLAAMAGSTTLMRASIGNICAAAGGEAFITALLDECGAIATASGYPPRPSAEESARAILTEAGSALKASMLRDIENGRPIEAEHIIGDLIARGRTAGIDAPLLRIVYTHLSAYQANRTRAATAAASPLA